MLTSLVSLLPASAQPYAKTIAAAILSALTTVSALVADVPQWVTVVVAVLSTPVVFAVPNLDPAARKQDESVQPPQALAALSDPAPVAPPAPAPDKPQPSGYWGGV